MRDSYSLGRILGIRIGLNWSVLLLLFLLMWTLATGIFPDTNPGLGDNAYFSMAVVASLGFFASILLHELGHAVQARRDGMEIDGITLWLFGGVARFTGMFPSAGAEFRIAAAGPLVSLLLGGGLVGLAFLPGLPEPVDAVCAWLGFINLALLVFNLIPALPLDGGRMLRAALWQWRGDVGRATVVSAGIGRVLALCLIGAGIALFVLDRSFSGVWLAFIGWFLLQAATAEGRHAASLGPRGAPRVADLMVRDPVTTDAGTTIRAFVERTVWSDRHRVYPVVRDGRAVGLLPLDRVATIPQERWDDHLVEEHMVPRDHLPLLTPDDDLPTAIEALRASGLHRALVVDGDHLAGLLTMEDLARLIGAPRAPVSA
ncbi:MAG: site-2 protease family protein [Thermoleophilia bacterium]